jgi:hypothetical protein
MVDVFAHEESRNAFKKATDDLAAVEGADDAVTGLRALLLAEPLAILYAIDGSFVKASPTILMTNNGSSDNSAATVQMIYRLRKGYKEHLAKNRGEARIPHYSAAEVTSEVGV